MTATNLNPDLALYGAPGVGKSTAAGYLADVHAYRRVSVAGYHPGGVRDVAVRLWGSGADQDRPKLNALMKLRDFDPDVWMRNYRREVVRQRQLKRSLVTDDFRGDNEWQLGHELGIVFIHLVADDAERFRRLERTGKLEGSGHPFLYVLEDTIRYHPDYVVDANATQAEVAEALVDIINIERRKRS